MSGELGPGTYRVSTYDPVEGEGFAFDWRIRADHLPLMKLRAWIRRLRGEGYED